MKKSYHKQLTFRKASPKSNKLPGEYDPKPFVPSKPINPKKRSTGHYSMTIYPNGEFGIGYLGREKKKVAEKKYDNNIVGNIQVKHIPREHELTTGEKYYDSGDMIEAMVKLDSGSKLSHPKKRYGQKGITSYGKKMIRNGAFIMHRESKTSRGKYLQFSTLTLPPLPQECELIICSNWSVLVRRFFEECTRQYRRHDRLFKYVCVTEIQMQRWETRGEVGLHLHFIYNAEFMKSLGKYCLTDDFVRTLWWRLIHNLLTLHLKQGEDSPFPLPVPMYRREKVKKSAEGYIGKYMSKGGEIVYRVKEVKGVEYLPKQWWTMDKTTKKLIFKETIKTLCTTTIGFVMDTILGGGKGILYSHEAKITIKFKFGKLGEMEADMVLGYGGKMSEKLRIIIDKMLSF